MSFKFLNEGKGEAQRVSPIDTFIDPVSKIRVSNPSNLIDTDFEYGLQPTKWETVELINNTPAFFSKGGDTTIPDITAITTNAGTREITVTTAFPHNLDIGIPIRVSGTKSVTADGSYIINATPTNISFTYLARGDQPETVSIFDLYTSIITGEFFQGSQISIDSAEGITTDGGSPSVLTVKTENKHGFGPSTPFYFLNLNSTIAQEFEAQNTATVSFDPTNSATAQTFDGSNTLLQTPIDLSNSATTSTIDNTITSTDPVNSTITVSVNSADLSNWANLKVGDPLYYAVSAGGGYFQDNPRGVVFIKSVANLITGSNATFQVSQLPDGSALPILANTTGNFRIANQARTFAGNNKDPETQIDITILRGEASTFDAANAETVVAGVQGYSGSTINLLVAQGTIDYYVGTMLLYSTDGTPPAELSNNSTYFVTAFAAGQQAGLYTMSIAQSPGGTPINFATTGSGTQSFKQIGISLDKDIIHVKDASFQLNDMLEYVFPTGGAFGYETEDNAPQKTYFWVSTVFDAHNYELREAGAPLEYIYMVAIGGNDVFDVWDNGRLYRVHEYNVPGTFTFEVVDGGTDSFVEYSVVGSGNTLFEGAPSPVSVTEQSYSIVVGSGESNKVSIRYPLTDINEDIIAATGGEVSTSTQGGTIYAVHQFKTVGASSFVVTNAPELSEVEYLVVAGGGGGGSLRGGGGGAGGYRSSVVGENSGRNSAAEAKKSVTVNSYSVVVGGGGLPNSTADGRATAGGNSSFDDIVSIGGGGGGNWRFGSGGAGGSGGGSADTATLGTGTAAQGFDGGRGSAGPSDPSGGGGGAGAAGVSNTTGTGNGGDGGIGISSSITGSLVFRAGGGGGGVFSTAAQPGAGGNGGGGSGAVGNVPAEPGSLNTGGGGGGGRDTVSGAVGGSGIVIIRYPIGQIETTPAAGSITATGGDSITEGVFGGSQ